MRKRKPPIQINNDLLENKPKEDLHYFCYKIAINEAPNRKDTKEPG